MNRRAFLFVAAGMVGLVLWAEGAGGAIMQFQANLDGAQETPPDVTNAHGVAILDYDTVANTFSLEYSVDGISKVAGNGFHLVTATHIHAAAPGVPGPVIKDLNASLFTEPLPGFLHRSITSDTFPAANVADLLANNCYINLHTTLFPGGEIRGQLIAVPEPASAAVLGLGAVGVLMRRRRA
jgi:hypothetical protein